MLNEFLAVLVPLSFVNGLLLSAAVLAGVLEIVVEHFSPAGKWLDQAMGATGFCRNDEVSDDGQPEE